MQLRWNAGGWFGSQVGATAWIGVAAALTAFQDLRTGLALLALFAVPNVIGLWLWRRRDRTSAYAGTQVLIASAGAAGLGAIAVLDNRALWEEIQRGGTVSAGSTYLIVVLVVAVLMLVTYLRFGRG